jgi:hypothetical protein
VSFTSPTPVTVTGAYFTNTTYAALSMLSGDSFAKKFGGASGDDPDWFKYPSINKLHISRKVVYAS